MVHLATAGHRGSQRVSLDPEGLWRSLGPVTGG